MEIFQKHILKISKMNIDKKQFKRLKNRVIKKYPNASTQLNSDGMYCVNLGEGATLVDDYMIPPQKSVALAWYWVNEIIKVNQNIERTHPNRMDIGTFERKFNRISKRNKQK